MIKICMKNYAIVAAILIIVFIAGGYMLQQRNKSASAGTTQETLESSDATNKDTNETNVETQQKEGGVGMQFDQAPKMEIDAKKKYSAVVATDKGDITIDFTTSETPITVNNFVFLAKKGFYNNVIFHRVIKGFMIQSGDPTGTGRGGPGYRFDDEKFSGDYSRGTVAMANAGPDTNGSQFFIMHQDGNLPPNYVIFGHVTKGLDVVDAIANAEVTTSDSGEKSNPVNPVKIKSIKIVEQ